MVPESLAMHAETHPTWVKGVCAIPSRDGDSIVLCADPVNAVGFLMYIAGEFSNSGPFWGYCDKTALEY